MTQTKTPTAAACSRESCDGCEIEGKLLCIHTQKDLMDFFVLFIGWALPFFAGMVIGGFWLGLAVWIGLSVIFFGYVEARILCRHCPHYAEDGFTLKCHANWGLPKFPRFDPHPISRAEKAIWLFYAAVLFLYYIPFFVISGQWLLLAITTWGFIVWAWTLQRTQCNRCYNLSCPVNRVPDDVQRVFFEHYPDFAQAWGRVSKNQAVKPAHRT
jgi:hypothetical protein